MYLSLKIRKRTSISDFKKYFFYNKSALSIEKIKH